MKSTSVSALIVTLACLLALCCVQRTQCYTYARLAKEFKGQCVLQQGSIIPPGDILYDNKRCEAIQCFESRGKLYESAVGCGVISAPEECEIVAGQGQYPDCCPDVKC